MMKKLDGVEVKQYVLGILLDLQKVCEVNDLTFYLSGGSLLGAIRHQGFIPWDDDVDVCMPRPDYDRLLQLSHAKDTFPENIKLCCYSEGNSQYPFIKLLDTNTVLKQSYIEEREIGSLWIDVFPVDGLPCDFSEQKGIYAEAQRIRKILMLNFAKIGEGKTRLKKLLKPLVIPFAKLVGVRRCNEKLDRLSRHYSFEQAKNVGVIMWGLYGTGETMDRSEFKQNVSVTFEAHEFKAMSCWDSYLHNIYGNYMELPPKEKRITHELDVWVKDDI